VLAARKLVEEQTLGTAVAGVMAFIGGESVVSSDHGGLGYLLLDLIAVIGLSVVAASVLAPRLRGTSSGPPKIV
jgi:hypothetical protein